MIDYKKQGKKNRANGKAFELRVRKNLESMGWAVFKNSNTVDLKDGELRLIPCKQKFNPFTKSLMMNSGGFPDFIAIKQPYITTPAGLNFWGSSMDMIDINPQYLEPHIVIGIECKLGKYLDSKEKEKCQWLIDNKIFSKILVAHKGKKRGQIEYKEWSQ